MRRLQLKLALMVVCGALLIPSAAYARVSEYQVQYTVRGESGLGQLIVNVMLSPETTLPATVQVPLPTGAKVVWSGEIVGEEPTADPFREAVVSSMDGGLMATFTMEQVRVAQVEADLPAPTVSGNEVSSVLNWVNTGEEGPFTFAVVLEAGAGDVKISPAAVGQPISNDVGETLRTLAPVRLAAGQSFSIDVRYRTGGGGGGGTTSTVLIIGAIVLAIALVVLLVVLRVQRAAARPEAADGSASNASAATFEAPEVPKVEGSQAAPQRLSETPDPDPDGDDFSTSD
jgi:hypothetical protein